MKKKLLLTSILSVIMCFSLICGATFALFTSESKINIAVQAANVEVNATVKDGTITTKSFDKVISENALEGTFENGGTAKFTDTANLKLDLLTPGDEVSFTIDVENKSNVSIKYRVEMVADGELAPALKGSANINGQDYDITAGVTKWFDVAAEVEIADIVVTVSFPDAENNNDYKNKTADIEFAIVAVQGNASVVDVNTSGTLNTDTTIKDAKGNSAKVPAGATLGDGAMTLTLKVDQLYTENEDGSVDVAEENVKTGYFKLSDGSTAYPFEVTIPEIDNDNNDTAIIITLHAPADLPGATLFHEGEKMTLVASADEVDEHHEYFYDATGSITFATKNFSNFTLVDVLIVSTADELVAALANTACTKIVFNNNITIGANMSNSYGKTGINILNNQTLNGNGYTLNVEDATTTWDSAINITGGTIKNITIASGFRGIFVNHNSSEAGKVYLENVTIDGPVYTISCDQGTNNGLEATDCEFYGWTSFAADLGEAKFVNCTFGEGNGYAYCRPYAPTEFINCTFEAGYKMDAVGKVVLVDCELDGVKITDENLATLVTSNTKNATVDNFVVVTNTEELISTIKSGKKRIALASGNYAGNIEITVAALGTMEASNLYIKAATDVSPVITGTVTLGYRNQGVGNAMWNDNVTFEGITFDHALAQNHSLNVQDVKSLTLKDCKIIGDGEYGITSARGNATGTSKIVGCTFQNAGMQLLGNFATGLVIEGCTFEESCINVQAGNGVTIRKCSFKNTLTDANVGESFYMIRSNSTPITVEKCTFAIDSKLATVAEAQDKWGVMWNRGTTNWTVSDITITLTDAAKLQTALEIAKTASTGAINCTNVTVNGETL